jgi:hypothetical protein
MNILAIIKEIKFMITSVVVKGRGLLQILFIFVPLVKKMPRIL